MCDKLTLRAGWSPTVAFPVPAEYKCHCRRSTDRTEPAKQGQRRAKWTGEGRSHGLAGHMAPGPSSPARPWPVHVMGIRPRPVLGGQRGTAGRGARGLPATRDAVTAFARRSCRGRGLGSPQRHRETWACCVSAQPFLQQVAPQGAAGSHVRGATCVRRAVSGLRSQLLAGPWAPRPSSSQRDLHGLGVPSRLNFPHSPRRTQPADAEPPRAEALPSS